MITTNSKSHGEIAGTLACENICFFSLFAAGDVSSETSPAAKSVDKRMFSQATSTCTTQNLKPAETASKWLEKRSDCGTDNTNKRLVIFIFEYFQKAESEFRTWFVYSHDFFKKYKFQRTFTEPSSKPRSYSQYFIFYR